MKLDRFIEDNFLVDDAETGALVPFRFRKVQRKYYEALKLDYNEDENFRGLREIILKARKEGFTSMILAIFAAVMILDKNPVRFLEVSYKDESTRQHFTRIHRYIMSYFGKKFGLDPIAEERKLIKLVYRTYNENSEIELLHNQASFYVGTASARTAERGGTTQGILFTEAAHFPDTTNMKASEIVEGSSSMIAPGSGMIFIETTAKGNNWFQKMWKMAKARLVLHKPRFFGWPEMYTPEEFDLICAGFADKSMIPQEYPKDDTEAFLASGDGFFDQEALRSLTDQARKPITVHLMY